MKTLYTLLALLLITTANAGLPPTATKVSGDSTFKGTTNFDFSNFSATRSGGTTTFGILGIAGGGTGASSSSAARTNLGLGTLATQSGTFSGTSSGTNTGDQTNISGNAATSTLATNLLGGLGGSIPYQSAVDTTAMLANGTVGQVLTSQGTTLAPVWSTPSGTGTVTSVAASVPAFLSIAGSPITTSGTLAITLSGTALPLANGGSGQTSAQTSMNAFAGAVTSGSYLRGNGTNVVMDTIQAGDVPTLNQNTTGTASNITGTTNSTITTLSALSLPGSQVTGNISGNAANVSGTVAIGNGGTGQTTASTAFNALSPMTTGGDLIYGGASGAGTRLANGTAGQVLQSNGTTLAPTWVTPASAGIASVVDDTSPQLGGILETQNFRIRNDATPETFLDLTSSLIELNNSNGNIVLDAPNGIISFSSGANIQMLSPVDMSLGQINNLADGSASDHAVNKGQLDLKAALASPALTGNPTAPTQAANNNSTRIATTAYVEAAITAASTAPNISGTKASPTLYAASANITQFSSTLYNNIIFVAGNGAAVSGITMNACALTGQHLQLIGEDATNTVTIADSANVSQNGTVVLGLNSIISYICDSASGVWTEEFRR